MLFFVILQDWHLSFLMTEINWIFLDDKVGKLNDSWLQGWPEDSS
jgi:hypothetical protein